MLAKLLQLTFFFIYLQTVDFFLRLSYKKKEILNIKKGSDTQNLWKVSEQSEFKIS